MPALSTVMPLENLLQFGVHFVVVAIAMIVSATLWLWATPFKEIALIRAGNTAAAASFGGALVGFALPLAGVVRASNSIWEVIPWSGLALLTQLAGLFIASRLLHGVTRHIEHGELASGLFMASVAISIGILNAACLGG
jgi:putative membrane protein